MPRNLAAKFTNRVSVRIQRRFIPSELLAARFVPQVQSWAVAMEFAAVGRTRFGPGSEFGFRILLRIFNLLIPIPRTDPNPVQHTLGFGFPAPPHQINPLPFLPLTAEVRPSSSYS